MIHRLQITLGLCCLALAGWAHAQSPTPTETGPRGLTDTAPVTLNSPAVNNNPAAATDAARLLQQDSARPDAERPAMFGSQLFKPGSTQAPSSGFNRDYVLMQGDRVQLRMWGAFTFDAAQTIDPQGNVFIPNVGPVKLAGVRNENLDTVVKAAVGQVYRSNVGVYAALDASQPVRVFVTGYVMSPGQYGGVASESVLGYLARAGGVDPQRGSYVDVRLLRRGQERARFDLYRFLTDGYLDEVQLQDGDTLVVGARRGSISVTGEVFNAYTFEFAGERIPASDLLRQARPRPNATHLSVVRKNGPKQTGAYYPLDRLDGVVLQPGDEVSVVADRTLGTILVRVDGANDGLRVLTLPYGARLREALERVTPSPRAQLDAVQLFRTSVAKRQKEMLDVSLRGMETYALTGRSSTSEEAALRTREAELIMRFVERARTVQPKGQVVLASRASASETPLEDGDVIVIPERTNTVMVHGEVAFPKAVVWDQRSSMEDYLKLAGGTNQDIDNAKVLLMRRNGTFEEGLKAKPAPGDEIIVLPKVGAKSLEVTRGITSIIYQIAVGARVLLGL